MAEPVLHKSGVGALIGEHVAAGVPKQLRVHWAESGSFSRLTDQVVPCQARELRALAAHNEPR